MKIVIDYKNVIKAVDIWMKDNEKEFDYKILDVEHKWAVIWRKEQ